MAVKAIDLWVNVSMGASAGTEFMVRVKEDYFKGGEDFFSNLSPDQTIEAMDRAGVEKCVLTADPEQIDDRFLEFPKQYPGRFFFGLQPDLKRGMKALWALEEVARQHPVVLARVTPFLLDVPPGDPIYYPLYAKCIELDLACAVNTGIPGPPMPGE